MLDSTPHLNIGIQSISNATQGLLEEHYFSEPQPYEVGWGERLSSMD